MKKIVLFLLCFALSSQLKAQLLCDANGSYILYTNYDGGTLNIDVDVNIPNLKIGIVSYEAVSINLTGAYVNNVTEVRYAGYNSQNNNNCQPMIPTTVINGAPGAAITSITASPASPLNNPLGNPNIICVTSCDTTMNQGGCNTVDQIDAYFAAQFPGSIKRFHKVQYGCWTGTNLVSAAGNCCINAPQNNFISITGVVTQPICTDSCTGSIIVQANGGTPPYLYNWVGGPIANTYSNLCPGIYTVIVTDANAISASQIYTIINPAPIVTNITQTACFSYNFNGTIITSSGTYTDTFMSAYGCDSTVILNLTINTLNNAITQAANTLTAVENGATYKWLNCTSNTTIPGATAQSYTATMTGSYAAIITKNGCTDTSLCKSVVVSSINEINENTLIAIYPNPIHDELNIDIDATFIGKKYYIYDMVGKMIESNILTQTKNKILVNHLSKNIYFIQIESAHKIWKVQK